MGLAEGVLNTFLVVEAKCDHPCWQGDLGQPHLAFPRCLVHSRDFKIFLLVFYTAAEWEVKGLAEA